MYCHCHLDESSPHIHVGIVPITPDGRLSAKSLFSPKTLEQLQTDFHRNVSSHYGLERGQSHVKKYLPIQKFKAQQAKSRAEQFTKDLQTADFNSQKIRQATQSAHYATSGIVFTSKDKEHVQMPTKDFLLLKHFVEQGLKAVAQIDLLKDDIQKLKHDEAQTQSDLSFSLRQLSKIEMAPLTKLFKLCIALSKILALRILKNILPKPFSLPSSNSKIIPSQLLVSHLGNRPNLLKPTIGSPTKLLLSPLKLLNLAVMTSTGT